MSAQTKPVTQQLSPLAAQIAARARQSTQPSGQSTPAARPPVSLVQMRPIAQPEVFSPSSLPVDQDDLIAWDKGLTRAIDGHRNTLVEIAYYGSRIRASNGWEKLGFVDEDAYRQDKGMAEKTWNQYLKLGERLSHLSLQEMSRLTFTAAHQLTKVDSRIWDEFAWTEEAALLPNREFQMLVDQRNREVNPAAAIHSKGHLNMEISLAKLPVIEKRIDQLRRQQHLQSTAETVEYALGAAERERKVADKLLSLDHAMGELANLWQPDSPWSSQLSEPDSERDVRLKTGAPTGLTDAAILSQRIVRRIMKSLESLHEVLPEAPHAGRTQSSSKPTSREEV